MRSKGSVLRPLTYILCLAVLVAAVILRRQAVSAERSGVTISSINEVRKYGKPVTVLEIKSDTFDIKEKFTVVPKGPTDFEGYVTRKMASSLKTDQKVYALNGHSGTVGRVSYMSPEVDMFSGLYRVEIEFSEPVVCRNDKLLVETKVGERKDIIEVPNDALEAENGHFYLWKVVGGKARHEEVELSARSGYSSIVKSGLSKGDILVISGQSQLNEGDNVRIIDRNQ